MVVGVLLRQTVRSQAILVRAYSNAPAYEFLKVTTAGTGSNVSLITLSRAKLNPLSSALMHELNDALRQADEDPSVGSIVLTGNERAFAAGADILEMKDKTFAQTYGGNFLSHWTAATGIRKPIIAAVSGYAVC